MLIQTPRFVSLCPSNRRELNLFGAEILPQHDQDDIITRLLSQEQVIMSVLVEKY